MGKTIGSLLQSRTRRGGARPVWVLVMIMAAAAFGAGSARAAEPSLSELFPGAKPLVETDDRVRTMLWNIHGYLELKTRDSIEARERHWSRDTSSPGAYADSIEPNRAEFARRIGLIHPRVPAEKIELEFIAGSAGSSELARADNVIARAVRWPALEGVHAEGIALFPDGEPRGMIIALPDADQTPEQVAGLALDESGKVLDSLNAGYALGLARRGYLVLIPTLIDRSDEFSVNEQAGKKTNQPHREFIYRMAYELGSHVIGYEVAKVQAAIDWRDRRMPGAPVGVIGWGEGGLIAFYTAAADPRVTCVGVSGYFDSRQNLAREPIHRNVWGLLEMFGDAEIASLVAPRGLIIEAAAAPDVKGPPEPGNGRYGAAPGRVTTPDPDAARDEFHRARKVYQQLGHDERNDFILSGDGRDAPMTERFLNSFINTLGGGATPDTSAPEGWTANAKARPVSHLARMERQVRELVDFTQAQLRRAADVRDEFQLRFFASKPASPEEHARMAEAARKHFAEEVIGDFGPPTEPPVPRIRKLMETPAFTGYEVELDVWEGPEAVFAAGILLVPKELKPGERRPVVVCQHGLEGRPIDTIEPNKTYQQFSARIAELGYIVFAPQNPYIFEDEFRLIQRKANPLKKSLFSIIVGQHRQILNWLETLAFVDPARIGFYGLSYGGKTAMRVPAIETRYVFSICSGDFNEWIVKNATVDSHYSYMFTGEYEMPEFDLGRTFNYAEMAALICPRPFMVERGHRDGVAPDEWVAAEYAKVRRMYDELEIGERTRIEFFNGPHQIHGVGTYEFIKELLPLTVSGAAGR